MNAYTILALAWAGVVVVVGVAMLFTAGSGVPSDAFDVHADESCELTQVKADEFVAAVEDYLKEKA